MKNVTLRKFPYPFKAALTICSDIDSTDTVEKFLAIQNFLNSEQDTGMGPGVGLEIGNSFFPITPNGDFAYLSGRAKDREIIRDFIKAGYIDSIHSYGDGAQSREDCLRALDVLDSDGCRVNVWINHSANPTNWGEHFQNPAYGDVAGSRFYNADVTMDYGIKYAWMGRSTSLVGQEAPLSLRALKQIYDPNHHAATVKDLAKELGKIALAKAGNRRFAINRDNRLLRVATLRDGQKVFEFNRCNNHWHKPGPSSANFPYILRPQVLENLKFSEGYMIVYTHLGNIMTPPFIPPAAQIALRNLAGEYRKGEIYITTTSRLLTYHLSHRYLDWRFDELPENQVKITIHRITDPVTGPRKPTLEELQGITFYVPDNRQASLFLGDKPVASLTRNPKDHTGRESVMIPRTFLSYPISKQTLKAMRREQVYV